MNKNREQFAAMITGYIDGELSAKDTKKVEKLLAESKEFYDYYLTEKRTKELLKRRVSILRAPLHLRNRIRRQIARTGYRPGFLELLQGLFDYRPVATSLAFSIIAILIVLPNYRMIQNRMIQNGSNSFVSHSMESLPPVRNGQLAGEIICLDCDVFNPLLHPSEHHDPLVHRPGLRADDGSIWTILVRKGDNNLKYSRDLLRKHATLTGMIFENSRYIQVNKYEIL